MPKTKLRKFQIHHPDRTVGIIVALLALALFIVVILIPPTKVKETTIPGSSENIFSTQQASRSSLSSNVADIDARTDDQVKEEKERETRKEVLVIVADVLLATLIILILSYITIRIRQDLTR